MKEVLLLLLHVIIFPIHTKAQSIRFEYELNQIEDTLSKYPQKFNTAMEITQSVKSFMIWIFTNMILFWPRKEEADI